MSRKRSRESQTVIDPARLWRATRDARLFSVAEMAKRLGWDVPKLNLVLCARLVPTADEIVAIDAILG